MMCKVPGMHDAPLPAFRLDGEESAYSPDVRRVRMEKDRGDPGGTLAVPLLQPVEFTLTAEAGAHKIMLA